MSQQKSKNCFHKIIAFQYHKNCTEMASICQKHCQSYHPSNDTDSTVNVTRINSQYKKIKNFLIETIKEYRDKFAQEYEQLMKTFQLKFTQDMRQMEKELLSHLIRTVNVNKDILEKIENDRTEKLRCNEVFHFLENLNLEEKIKSATLLPIYEKHLNSFKIYHKNFNWNLKPDKSKETPGKSSNQTQCRQSTKTTLNSSELPRDIAAQNQLLKLEISKCMSQLKTESDSRSNIEKQLRRFQAAKTKNLSQNTWTIFRVISRKRIKKLKEITQNNQPNPIPFNTESKPDAIQEQESEDIVDYLRRQNKL